MAEIVVFSSRRARRMQRVQAARHVLIGITLALAGWQSLVDGHHVSWIDYLALVSGGLLLVAFVREMRAARAGHHDDHARHGVNWVDVFAGLVTFVEAAHLHHQGKVGLPIAYMIAAVLFLAVGLLHGPLSRVRRLIVDEQGFDLRLQPWRRIRRTWDAVAEAIADDTGLTLAGIDGSTLRLDLTDAPERAHVIDTFMRHATAARARAAETAVPLAPPASVDPPAATDAAD